MKSLLTWAAALLAANLYAESSAIAGGPIVINLSGSDAAQKAARITVDGLPYAAGTVIQDMVFPTQHCVRIEGVHLQRWTANGGINQPPLANGDHWLMGSANAAVTATHTAYVTTSAYWVDPTNGVDVADCPGTQAQPFRTLLYAAERAEHNSVIYCAAGDYEEGGYESEGMTNRVYNYGKNLRFFGAGIGKSILHGKLDLESPTHLANGRGPAAMRVACFSGYSVIQNFTVTDGRCASVVNGNVKADKGGGGYNAYFADCLITNCAANRGQAIYDGTLVRCRVDGCDSSVLSTGGRLLEGGAAAYCCAFGKQASVVTYLFQNNNTFWHCSGGFYSGTTSYIYGADTIAYNCVTIPCNPPNPSWGSFTARGCVSDWQSYPLPDSILQQDVLDADPIFVNAKAGDYRLFASSPAVGHGYLPENYYRTYSAGIDGVPVTFKDGKPTSGPYQQLVSGLLVTAKSGFANTDASGLLNVAPGESVTVSIVDAKRPPVGFVVNGEFVPGTSYTYTAPQVGDPERGMHITDIVIGTNWYVNAAMPNDDGDGFTPETAKRTLCGVMTNEYVIAGDVVHAAEGVYDEGTTGNTITKNRVSVKAGVTLVADGAMEKTLIVGAPAPVVRSTSYPGCGEGAVRCAYVSGTGILRGFVITNGYTEGDVAGSAGNDYCYGGGILAVKGGRIEDCLITQCRARRGDGVCGGRLRRCRFLKIATNPYHDWGGGSYGITEISDCYFDYCGELDSCPNTFVNNFVGRHDAGGSSRARTLYAAISSGQVIRNCIFCAAIRNLSNVAVVMTNCVYTGIQSHGSGYVLPTNEGFGGEMSYANITAQLAQDEQGLWTIKEDSSFVNRDADASTWALSGPLAINGVPRVSDGALDIGPWEWDWRPAFTQTIAQPGVSVGEAAPMVVEEDGKVRIYDGDLVLNWNVTSGKATIRRRMTFTVTGTGTLTVFADGVEVGVYTAAEKPQMVDFKNTHEESVVKFSYAKGEDDTGYVEIGEVIGDPGLVLIVR